MKWLRQAHTIDLLRQEIAFRDEREQDLGGRLELAQSELKAVRAELFSVYRRHADMMSAKAGSYPVFAKDAKPETDVPPEPELDSDRVQWAAEQMRQADIEAGREPWELEQYIEEIDKQGLQIG